MDFNIGKHYLSVWISTSVNIMRFHFTYYLNHLNTDDHYVALGQSVLLGRLNSGRTDSGGRLAGVPIVGPCSLEGRRVDI